MNYHSWSFRLILVVVGYIVLSSCSLASHAPASANLGSEGNESSELTAEEYAIYSALVEIAYNAQRERPSLISNKTSAYYLPFASPGEALDDLDSRVSGGILAEIRADFASKNNLPRIIKQFNASVPYSLLDQAELQLIFRDGNGWDDFFKIYPDRNLVTFSRIGFNKERNRALVYMGTEAGPKGGNGQYILFYKAANNWVIEQKLETWTS